MKPKNSSAEKNGFVFIFLLDFLFVVVLITLATIMLSKDQRFQELLASVVNTFKR